MTSAEIIGTLAPFGLWLGIMFAREVYLHLNNVHVQIRRDGSRT